MRLSTQPQLNAKLLLLQLQVPATPALTPVTQFAEAHNPAKT
jgi:hypothetical protein